MADSLVNVKSQTCENTYQYGSCSSNSACGCLPIVFAAPIGVCGLIGVSCSRLSSCLPDDTCPTADHICVYHSRCSSTPLCYPLSMTDQRLCPPMATTVGTTVPFFTTQRTTRSSFETSGTTGRAETTAYDLYNYTMDSFSSAGSIMSNYSNALTMNDTRNINTHKYYQTIDILVNTSGDYDIRSSSNMDTYGCLYRGSYNPSVSSNEMTCNDDYALRQFRLSSFLDAGVSYSVLVTTFGSDVTGAYSLVAYGPGEMEFNQAETFQTTMSTPMYFTSDYTYEFNSTYSDEFSSNYSDALTSNSGMFSRAGGSGPHYYYEAIRINVLTTGTYTFISSSNTSERTMDTTYSYSFTDGGYSTQGNMDAYGYIYQNNFHPTSPSTNLIKQDDDNGGYREFRLTVALRADVTYVLVFTTYSERSVGPFSILASGPDDVIFRPIKQT